MAESTCQGFAHHAPGVGDTATPTPPRDAFGGRGEGPGEFGHLTRMVPYRGDSIAVWDWRLGRLSIFDGEGRPGRTRRIEVPPVQEGEGPRSFALAATFRGAFADGSLAFAPMKMLRYHEGEDPVFRRPTLRYAPAGDSLGIVGPRSATQTGGLANPFPRFEVAAFSGNRLFMGTGERYEVERWSVAGALEPLAADRRAVAGTLELVVRIPGRLPRVDAEARAVFASSYRERQEQVFQRPESDIERDLAGIEFPSHAPPYSALHVDDDGYLWVEDYRLAADPRPATWNVFDAAGRWVGSVTLPARFAVHQIGTDFILGVRTGEMDVPFVEVYALSRPTP